MTEVFLKMTRLLMIESVVHECNERAARVRNTLSPFFEACNELVICYFQDVYGVDVTEKLNTLQIMEAAYPEDVSNMVGRSYSSDFPDSLFMNAALLDSFMSELENGEIPEITSMEFSVKMLRTIYIHKVIHYLGFNSDSIFDHFTEAIAECLNKKVMLHSGINYAEYYDKLIGLIQKGDNKASGKLAYYTQYLSYEYCKAANRNAREILKTANEGAVRLFEVKWLLGVYRKNPAK